MIYVVDRSAKITSTVHEGEKTIFIHLLSAAYNAKFNYTLFLRRAWPV